MQLKVDHVVQIYIYITSKPNKCPCVLSFAVTV